MNTNDSEEFLAFMRRLLDLLRQADPKNFGTKIQIVLEPETQEKCTASVAFYPAPRSAEGRLQGKNPAPQRGGENMVGGKPHPLTPSPTGEGERPRGGELSEVLATDKAMVLWQKAQDAGYVDEHYQPLLSRTQAALLADAMAKRLGIKEKWKVFETLWRRRNMYRDYYDAMNQDQTYMFLDKQKELFG